MRRQEQIDRESAELKAEGEREKARLKRGFAEGSRAGHAPAPPRRADGLEPAGYSMLGPYAVTGGIKRERGEESDGGADGRSPAKYPRTNSSHNGSRAGYQGYHDDVREDSRQRQAQEGTPTCFPPMPFSFPSAYRSTFLPRSLHNIHDALSSMLGPLCLVSSAQHTGASQAQIHSFVPLLTCSPQTADEVATSRLPVVFPIDRPHGPILSITPANTSGARPATRFPAMSSMASAKSTGI